MFSTRVDGFDVTAVTVDHFDDLVTILGRSGIGGCWCRYWTCATNAEWRDGTRGGPDAPNRAALLTQVGSDPPPGLIASEAGEPLAWCRVMPRLDLPGLTRSRHFATDLDVTGVWSLPCFVVRRQARGRGLTGVLVRAAIEFVREHGGSIVEAYPWDTDERQAASTAYTGLASTFHRLGFEVVQRKAPHKPMMRLRVTDAP